MNFQATTDFILLVNALKAFIDMKFNKSVIKQTRNKIKWTGKAIRFLEDPECHWKATKEVCNRAQDTKIWIQWTTN